MNDTDPVPVPASTTVNVGFAVLLNVAVTDCAEFIVTVHVLPPQSAPLQPSNVEPEPAVAVNVTVVPLA